MHIVQRALILAIVLAGPMLALYIASDRLFGEPLLARFLHALPWIFYAATVVSFTAGMMIARPGLSYGRSLPAIAVAVVMIVLALVLSWPLLFAIGESPWNKVVALVLLLCLTLLPAAIAHHFILRSGVPAVVVLPAHLVAICGPALILGNFNADSQTHLFSTWPAIVAAVPLALVAVAYAEGSLQVARALVAAAISVAPLYLAKAGSDASANRGNPFAWPARIAREFMPPKERHALASRITRVPKGMPARIGKHWYKFDSASINFAYANAVPDRIESLRLYVPATELDVPGERVRDKPELVVLKIFTARDERRKAGKHRDGYIYADYEDLTISVARTHPPFSLEAPVVWPSDDVVKARLSEYMRSHRVPPPASDAPAID